MATSSDIIEFARTLIQGDFEANDRYERKLDEAGWEGWPRFLSALFFIAVDRKFGGQYDESEAIRFVANLRAEENEAASLLDPSSSELLIRAVFDPSVQLNIPAEAMGQIQTLVAYKFLSQENLSEQALDDLLAEAKSIADGQPSNP